MKKSTTGGSGRKGRRSVERPKEESNDPIGYGRPPREHRFRPGQSGNPRGRPKGAQSLASQVQQAYTAPVIVHEGARTSRIPRLAAVARRQIDQALKGDSRAQQHTLQNAKDLGLLPDRSDEKRVDYDFTKLTDEELEQLHKLLVKMSIA